MTSATSANCCVAEAPGGQRRRADPQTRRHHRRTRVVGHRVAVHRDARLVQQVLGLLAVDRSVTQVDQHEVHVGAARAHADPGSLDVVGHQPLGQDLRPAHRALLTVAELLAHRDLERHGLRRDDVHQRAALLPGEHRGVDLLGQVRVVRQDEPGPRSADGLVHRGRHDVRVRHGRGVHAGGHQAGEVRHVDPQVRAHLVGDLTERGEVQLAGVGRPARDDDLGLVLDGEPTHLRHVHLGGLGVHAVRDDVVQPAREVDLHAVGQVAALVQGEAEDRVARAGRARAAPRRWPSRRSAAGRWRTRAPNSALARSMARFSATSTTSQPP